MSLSNLSRVLYGFTDMNTLNEKGPLVLTHGKGIYVFDDYGKKTHTKEILIGKPEQKERIRKYFQSPLLNERKELIKMNQYIQDNQDRLSNSPEAKEARDLIFGSSRS